MLLGFQCLHPLPGAAHVFLAEQGNVTTTEDIRRLSPDEGEAKHRQEETHAPVRYSASIISIIFHPARRWEVESFRPMPPPASNALRKYRQNGYKPCQSHAKDNVLPKLVDLPVQASDGCSKIAEHGIHVTPADILLAPLAVHRHLFEYCSSFRGHGPAPPEKRSLTPMALSTFKRGSPAQFAELKQRLAEAVVSAQQAGGQLQRCAQFFDSQEKRGFQREGYSGRTMWYELVAIVALAAFFLVPVMLKQTVFDYLASTLKPFATLLPQLPALPTTGWFAFLSSNVARVAAINLFVVLLFAVIIWSGLKD